MMTLNIQIVMMLLSGNGLFLSFIVHVGINIMKTVNKLSSSIEVMDRTYAMRFEEMGRHQLRNDQETDMLRRHSTGTHRIATGDSKP